MLVETGERMLIIQPIPEAPPTVPERTGQSGKPEEDAGFLATFERVTAAQDGQRAGRREAPAEARKQERRKDARSDTQGDPAASAMPVVVPAVPGAQRQSEPAKGAAAAEPKRPPAASAAAAASAQRTAPTPGSTSTSVGLGDEGTVGPADLFAKVLTGGASARSGEMGTQGPAPGSAHTAESNRTGDIPEPVRGSENDALAAGGTHGALVDEASATTTSTNGSQVSLAAKGAGAGSSGMVDLSADRYSSPPMRTDAAGVGSAPSPPADAPDAAAAVRAVAFLRASDAAVRRTGEGGGGEAPGPVRGIDAERPRIDAPQIAATDDGAGAAAVSPVRGDTRLPIGPAAIEDTAIDAYRGRDQALMSGAGGRHLEHADEGGAWRAATVSAGAPGSAAGPAAIGQATQPGSSAPAIGGAPPDVAVTSNERPADGATSGRPATSEAQGDGRSASLLEDSAIQRRRPGKATEVRPSPASQGLARPSGVPALGEGAAGQTEAAQAFGDGRERDSTGEKAWPEAATLKDRTASAPGLAVHGAIDDPQKARESPTDGAGTATLLSPADRLPLHADVPTERPVATGPSPSPMAQLARHVVDAGNRTVELTLMPRELGPVRMVFSGGDGAMNVTIHAGRAETLDLLRGNIHILSQEFRDTGFSGVSFSFGQWSDGPGTAPQPPVPTRAPSPEQELAGAWAPQAAVSAASGAQHSGLDLRL